jgi:hypothetical protein
MSVHNKNLRQLPRRRGKWIGFVIAEAMAISVLLLIGTLALLLRTTDPALVTLVNIATIAAGAAVAIIPIVFFGMAPILPRADR